MHSPQDSNRKAHQEAAATLTIEDGDRDWGSDPFVGQYHEVKEEFSRRIKGLGASRYDVVELGTSVKDKGCSLHLRFWSPMACQGRCWPELNLHYNAGHAFSPGIVTWSRNPRAEDEHPEGGWEERGFDALFDIFFATGITKFEIGALGHDAALTSLLRHLLDTRFPDELEFQGNKKDARVIHLCTKILEQKPRGITSVRFGNLEYHDQVDIDRFFQAIKGNTSLKRLDMPKNRYLRSWSKGSRPTHTKEETSVSITHLVEALSDPRTKLEDVNLGGIPLSEESVCVLAQKMPILDHLKKLSLRGTGLEQATLIAFWKGLQTNRSLCELDISHNVFDLEVMESLCACLSGNTTLQRLIAEHCDINYCQTKLLAEALPKCQGLRHLELDGNKFTYTRLIPGGHLVSDTVWARERNGRYLWESSDFVYDPNNLDHQLQSEPEGLSTIARGLERGNDTLLSLSMGQSGKVGLSFGVPCCCSPLYSEHIRLGTKNRIAAIRTRNEEHHKQMRKSRMQQAVIRISAMLLAKL